MNFRVAFAKFLIRLGGFIQAMAIYVMKPDDLVEFSRRGYCEPRTLDWYSSLQHLEQGLYDAEISLLEAIPIRSGRLLLLGVGGGREAIALAKAGFDVTGVDYVKEMIDLAVGNARECGLDIRGVVGDISKLDLDPGSFDLVWFTQAGYSMIPTRQRRVHTLRILAAAVRNGGYVVCQFLLDEKQPRSARIELAGRIAAALSLGNLSYEAGDKLHYNSEFLHHFFSAEELRSEFEEASLDVVQLGLASPHDTKWALLRKRNHASADT